MPRRSPIDPTGIYHVGSRGNYGRPLYETPLAHELFLSMHRRISLKYGVTTLAWALRWNHYHFVVALSRGGLSEAMRELNGGYSRWLHAGEGQTRKGHAFRHAFFARLLENDQKLIAACAYVDANPADGRASVAPRPEDWCGLAATLGLAHARPFHDPSRVLEVLGSSPATARVAYVETVQEGHDRRRQSLRQTR